MISAFINAKACRSLQYYAMASPKITPPDFILFEVECLKNSRALVNIVTVCALNSLVELTSVMVKFREEQSRDELDPEDMVQLDRNPVQSKRTIGYGPSNSILHANETSVRKKKKKDT